MTRRITSLLTLTGALFILASTLAPGIASARTIVVRSGDSIQDAVDAAQPGDTIVVKDGVYTGTPGDDSVVTVTTDDLTLIGSRRAVIDAAGFEYGIMVGEDAPIGPGGCPPATVHDFRIKGFTIRDAEDTGLRLVGVDGYRITHGAYLDNFEYGPFPICSTNGLIAHNFASGHEDAAIYVGDDDGVLVRHNTVTLSAIGIEVENTINAEVRHNRLFGNTAGILVVVLPGLPQPFTRNVHIHHNVITENDFPNPIPPGGGAVGLIPTGTGILNVGGDRVVIEENEITGNDSLGVALIGNPFFLFDPRIEPFVDDNVVRDNVITGNGASPDPLRATTPGVDIVFVPDVVAPGGGPVLLPDPDPTDNCFAGNVFGSDFPPGITALFPCP